MVVGFNNTPTLVSKNLLADAGGGGFDPSSSQTITGDWDYTKIITGTGSAYDARIGESQFGTGPVYSLYEYDIDATNTSYAGTVIGLGTPFKVDMMGVGASETLTCRYSSGIASIPTGAAPPSLFSTIEYQYDPSASSGSISMFLPDGSSPIGCFDDGGGNTDVNIDADNVDVETTTGTQYTQTGNSRAIAITTTSTSTEVLNISAPTVTTGHIFSCVDANSLTSGAMINLVSNSSSGSTRGLLKVWNNNSAANGASCITLQQESSAPSIKIDQIGDGAIIDAITLATTSDGFCIQADSLQSGSGLLVASDSSDTGGRSLGQFTNDNTAATGAYCLGLQQDADNAFINFSGSTGADTTSAISTLTTIGTLQGFFQADNAGTKVWIPFYSDPS